MKTLKILFCTLFLIHPVSAQLTVVNNCTKPQSVEVTTIIKKDCPIIDTYQVINNGSQITYTTTAGCTYNVSQDAGFAVPPFSCSGVAYNGTATLAPIQVGSLSVCNCTISSSTSAQHNNKSLSTSDSNRNLNTKTKK